MDLNRHTRRMLRDFDPEAPYQDVRGANPYNVRELCVMGLLRKAGTTQRNNKPTGTYSITPYGVQIVELLDAAERAAKENV